MATYQPPTENLPIFDPTVFAVSLAPLTQADADLLYLKFPTAQGTENLLAINVDGQAIFNSIASFPFALPTSTATVPAFTDSSTKIPTTAWVQGAITGAVPASILATNNTFTGTNAFNNIAPITSTATQPASTDSSTKIPTTAWVQSAIAVGSAGTLADVLLAGDDANKKDIVNLNGLNIVTTSGGAPNISLTTGIFNSCNNGATYTANVITPPNTTIGDKKMRQYFARLYFDPLRASSTNATLYQSVQVRTTLTLGLDNNAEVNGTANGMTNWYSTATYGFNWNYMWNFNVAFVDNTSNSQGMTVLDGTSGSNNSGSWSGIDPTIYVEKIGSGPNINYLAFYWVNKKGSAGGSNAFWDISACFTLELLNIGQSLDATSSAWIAPYLSQVPE